MIRSDPELTGLALSFLHTGGLGLLEPQPVGQNRP